jgi:hypothetical protein
MTYYRKSNNCQIPRRRVGENNMSPIKQPLLRILNSLLCQGAIALAVTKDELSELKTSFPVLRSSYTDASLTG